MTGPALDSMRAECERLEQRIVELVEGHDLERLSAERDRLAARVSELEAALREIDSLPNQSEHWHDNDVAVTIARAALDKEKT